MSMAGEGFSSETPVARKPQLKLELKHGTATISAMAAGQRRIVSGKTQRSAWSAQLGPPTSGGTRWPWLANRGGRRPGWGKGTMT